MNETFFDLVKLALPEDIKAEELEELAPRELWKTNNYEASVYALRRHPRINWQAYLEKYPDVKQAGLDPTQHFINHGIYEGRKLISWHILDKLSYNENRPLVSVIINNFNNSTFLKHCITSVQTQTLKEIEIIVVDDCSTDGSIKVVESLAAKDTRIRLIVHAENKGLFMGRKSGVKAARARYLMFLDADDFYTPSACEIALNVIIHGYDTVAFSGYVLPYGFIDERRLTNMQKVLDNIHPGEYAAHEITDCLLIKKTVSWQIINKIVLRDIARKVYEEQPDANLTYAEDVYFCLGLIRYARKMLVIKDKLFYYRYGTGVSTSRDLRKYAYKWLDLGKTGMYIKKYLYQHKGELDLTNVLMEHCSSIVSSMMQYHGAEGCTTSFKKLFDLYGFENVITLLIESFSDRKDKIAQILNNDIGRYISYPNPCVIGLYYHSISMNDIPHVLICACHALLGQGCKIVLFVDIVGPKDFVFPEEVEIVKITPQSNDGETMKAHVFSLHAALLSWPVDILISYAPQSPATLWHTMLCYALGIPIILCHQGGYGLHFRNELLGNKISDFESTWRCAAAMTCLSRWDELYFRMRGINATYMANPVYPAKSGGKRKGSSIVFVGRLSDDFKRIYSALAIFRLVAQFIPNARLYVVGDFDNDAYRDKFKSWINLSELQDKIIYLGWTQSLSAYFEHAAALLVTSYWEDSSIAISEALAAGVPCVVYELSIEYAINNSAVIMVKHGDVLGAARALISLCKNNDEWYMLSYIARKSIQQYSPQRFTSEMTTLISTYNKYSMLRNYSPDDYKNVIRYGSFYANKDPGEYEL